MLNHDSGNVARSHHDTVIIDIIDIGDVTIATSSNSLCVCDHICLFTSDAAKSPLLIFENISPAILIQYA